METQTPPSVPTSSAKRDHRERWWWLVAFLAISLLIHLGLGWESRGWKLTGESLAALATPGPGEIEVALGPPAKKQAAPKAPAASKAEPTPGPEPTAPPTKEAPSKEHNPREAPVTVKAPIRPDRPVSTVKTMKGETLPTNNRPHVFTPNMQVPSPATPLPEQTQQPKAQFTPHPINAPVGLPDAPEQPTGLPPTLGGAGTHDVGTVGPRTRAPLPNSNTGAKAADQPDGKTERNTPAGGSAGEGAPVAGPSTRIGLTRGIPFGARTGLSGGSSQGDGLGPDGQPLGVSGGGHNGGEFHLHLSRPTAASMGLAPARIVYVLDVSGSMVDDNKITLARHALHQAVSELLPDDSFDFITFSDVPHNYSQTLRLASTFNISNQESNIDLVQPEGQTDLSDALDMALAMSGVTHIFLISDGEPTVGITDHDELRAHIRARNPGSAIHISTFALGDGEQFEGVQLLRQIAAENAGEYRYINDKGR